MTLTLYQHPLASFCHKVTIALYEMGAPFKSVVVNLGDKEASAAFFALSPTGKIPLLYDQRADHVVWETSIIIEYLDQHHCGPRPMLPQDRNLRLETRLWDRFFDFYIHEPMQKIVGDRLRAENERDPRGVADAKAGLQKAYGILEQRMGGRTWIMDDDFTMADCAAAPALFYAGIVCPFDDFRHVSNYFDRLTMRASVARTLKEARPYFQYFPFKELIPERFLD